MDPGDATSLWTPAHRTAMVVFVPDAMLEVLASHFQMVHKDGGGCRQRSRSAGDFTPSWRTSRREWIRYPALIGSASWGSISMEHCTRCTRYYPSRLIFTPWPDISLPAMESCLAKVSLWWWSCTAPCAPYRGLTTSVTWREWPLTFGS